MPDPMVKKLRDAVNGLLYLSEQDAPFEVIEWDAKDELTADRVRELGKHPKRAPVAQSDFREFIQPLTQEQDWYEDEEKARVGKYKELLAVFDKELTDPTVFRVGKVKATYFLLGRSKTGKWVGVKTEAVET
jgi:hypothetical protein